MLSLAAREAQSPTVLRATKAVPRKGAGHLCRVPFQGQSCMVTHPRGLASDEGCSLHHPQGFSWSGFILLLVACATLPSPPSCCGGRWLHPGEGPAGAVPVPVPACSGDVSLLSLLLAGIVRNRRLAAAVKGCLSCASIIYLLNFYSSWNARSCDEA